LILNNTKPETPAIIFISVPSIYYKSVNPEVLAGFPDLLNFRFYFSYGQTAVTEKEGKSCSDKANY